MDSSYFDVVGSADLATRPLRTGEERILARFRLPERYCGMLEGFAQLTDRWEETRSHETPGIRWSLRAGGRPLAPYNDIRMVVNPWGDRGFRTGIRLEERATLEFVVAGVEVDPALLGAPPITRIAGRIQGRYWYNVSHGDREDPCF